MTSMKKHKQIFKNLTPATSIMCRSSNKKTKTVSK